MTVKNDIKNTIKILKALRKFRSQEEVAEHLGYNASYFSRTLGGADIPIDFEDKFFKAFPRSVYLHPNHKEPDTVREKPNKYRRADTINIPEGKEINIEDVHSVRAIVIPIKGQAGLQSNYYDDILFAELGTEELLTTEKHVGKYFKIEVNGDSMDDGTSKSLQCGDWAYCRSVPKMHWREKLYTHKWRIWCFFHNDRGIIFKSIVSHNIDTGEMELESLNPDKMLYPNFTINIGECSYVCNVVKKLAPL